MSASWCPHCERQLIGGNHFNGRKCGTCHGRTLAVPEPINTTRCAHCARPHTMRGKLCADCNWKGGVDA